MLVDSNTERFLSADRPEIYGGQTAFCFLSDPLAATGANCRRDRFDRVS